MLCGELRKVRRGHDTEGPHQSDQPDAHAPPTPSANPLRQPPLPTHSANPLREPLPQANTEHRQAAPPMCRTSTPAPLPSTSRWKEQVRTCVEVWGKRVRASRRSARRLTSRPYQESNVEQRSTKRPLSHQPCLRGAPNRRTHDASAQSGPCLIYPTEPYI